ncbi:MAG: chemotaxis protein CheB [Bacteroidales bacterium]|nr:chemotaxis protein CheB [Bacteroidales bacterium]
MAERFKYEAIVIGTSAGGLLTLKKMLPALPADFPCPIIVVQHISPQSDGYFIKMLDDICSLQVKEAVDTEQIKSGTIYFASPDYHLLIERDHTITLTMDEKVNYSRPSIDVLFETAAEAYGEKLIGLVLTGANADGASGLLKIKQYGGCTIVQNPEEAENPVMPEKAIRAVIPDHIADINEIVKILVKLCP